MAKLQMRIKVVWRDRKSASVRLDGFNDISTLL